MKKLFLSFALISAINLFAGPPKDGDRFDWLSHQTSFNLSVGKYNTDFRLLNTQMSLWGATTEFNPDYYMFGTTSAQGEPDEDGWRFDGASSLEFMPSQTVSIGANDSVSYRMKGWHGMTSSFGKDLIPGDVVALVLGLGVDWGNMKIIRSDAAGDKKYKNPYVCPLGRADLRFMFGKFSIGGRAYYRYDITHSLWKRKADLMPVLPGTKFTGLGFQAFIGFQINSAAFDNPLDKD
jgi:hypothetical protein